MALRAALFILGLQLVSNDINSQLKVTPLKLERYNEVYYSFPLVQSAKPRVGQKINAYLQKELLYNDTILTDKDSVFQKSRYINGDSTWQSGYSAMSYEIEVNNTKVLSISFELESTGAYTDNYQMYYNFKVETGALVTAKDLFTPAGIVEIKRALKKERQKRIREWIKEMDTTYNMEDSREYVNERFADCNKDASVDNFLIKKNSIVFAKASCFPHAGMSYETDLDIQLAFTKIQQLLSANGKKLLLQKN
ncbi:MAG TPA: hypothetical protein VFI06_17660 [Chitinophagaceae bacterium]|nr:hypothetical protein [Chitinophagaceae bacterium]